MILLCLVFTAMNLHADVIFLKDGSFVRGRIQEQNLQNVKFKNMISR